MFWRAGCRHSLMSGPSVLRSDGFCIIRVSRGSTHGRRCRDPTWKNDTAKAGRKNNCHRKLGSPARKDENTISNKLSCLDTLYSAYVKQTCKTGKASTSSKRKTIYSTSRSTKPKQCQCGNSAWMSVWFPALWIATLYQLAMLLRLHILLVHVCNCALSSAYLTFNTPTGSGLSSQAGI